MECRWYYFAAQGYDGDVEQYRIPSLTLKNTLQEVHVVDVTCIDYRLTDSIF